MNFYVKLFSPLRECEETNRKEKRPKGTDIKKEKKNHQNKNQKYKTTQNNVLEIDNRDKNMLSIKKDKSSRKSSLDCTKNESFKKISHSNLTQTNSHKKEKVKKMKQSPTATIESDSYSSDEEESSNLLNSHFKKHKQNKEKLDKSKISPEKDGSVNDIKITSGGKRRGKPSRVQSDTSHSDSSVNDDIHIIARKHLKYEVEPMSDFSISSPKKSKKQKHSIEEMDEVCTTLMTDSTCKKKRKRLKSGDEYDIVYKSRSKKESKEDESDMSESLLSHQNTRNNSINSESNLRQGVREQKLNLRYKTPQEFEPVKIMDLRRDVCIEELNDKELWLIKAPINFDIQHLETMTVDLDKRTNLITENNDRYEITGTVNSKNEMSSFTPVLYSTKTSSFVAGPEFKGQIDVMESLEIPELPPITIPEPIVHRIPEGLHPRFQPFGSGKPVKLKKKKRHHEEKEEDGTCNISPVKKKKKRKEH